MAEFEHTAETDPDGSRHRVVAFLRNEGVGNAVAHFFDQEGRIVFFDGGIHTDDDLIDVLADSPVNLVGQHFFQGHAQGPGGSRVTGQKGAQTAESGLAEQALLLGLAVQFVGYFFGHSEHAGGNAAGNAFAAGPKVIVAVQAQLATGAGRAGRQGVGLVIGELGAVFLAQGVDLFVVVVLRPGPAEVAHDRFHHHAGDLSVFENLFHVVQVVVGEDSRAVSDLRVSVDIHRMETGNDSFIGHELLGFIDIAMVGEVGAGDDVTSGYLAGDGQHCAIRIGCG